MKVNIKPLSQRDPRWANKLLGFNTATYTIGGWGCLITCLSMCKDERVDTMNDKLKAINGFANGGYYVWGSFQRLYDIPEKTTQTPSPLTKTQINAIKTALDNGFPVMCQIDMVPETVQYDMHFVLMVDYVGDAFKIADPWTGTIRPMTDYLKAGKTLATTVNSYTIIELPKTVENPTEGQIEALEKELQAMRESRDKCKREYEDERDKNTKKVKDMQEHIESLQKTISEHGQQTSGYMVTISNLEESNKILAEELLGCQRKLDVSNMALDSATRENERLTTKLKECKEVSNMEYPKWKIIAWRYVRVFLASFLVSFASGLVGATDFDALMALVVASITAAIPAIAKLLREEVSGGDQTSVVNKLPL